MALLHAGTAARSIRPLRVDPVYKPLPWARCRSPRPRPAPCHTRGGLASRGRAREAAPRQDVGARGGQADDATAARPVAPRGHLARGSVPGASRCLRPEQRARDRVDASGVGDGNARRSGRRPLLHAGIRRVQRGRRGGLGPRRASRRLGGGEPARGLAASVCSGLVKVASLETLFCDAGWRPWIFLKATADDGSVGWAEITDSRGSPHGLAGIIEDLAPLVVGRDPRPVEAIYWDLYRATRQSPGSVIAKALAGIENALLDLKAKALGVPVYELFGGPTRDSIQMYWSHCGTTRARAWEVTGTPKLASYDDVVALGREVVEQGYAAFKTNVVVPGDEPKVLMPGFNEGGGTLQAAGISEALVRLLEAFREGTGGAARPIVDLNFNLEPEGCVWVEV